MTASLPSRPVWLSCGQRDRALDRLGLVDGLLVLVVGLGVGHGAAAGLDVGGAVLDDDRADVDAGVQARRGAEGPDRAAVAAALDGLELVDDLHGPHLGRAAQRAG